MYSHFLIGMGRLPEALAQSQRLLEIDPLSPVAHDHLGYYHLIVGDYGKAIEESNRALALDPGFARTRAKLADAYAGLGRYKEAVDEYEKALPSFGVTAPQLAELRAAFERSGWRGHLRKRLDLLLASQRTEYVAPTEIAELYALLGENDRAVEWLERALAVHDDGLAYLKSPEYPADLRADPRYRDLLRRLRLPE